MQQHIAIVVRFAAAVVVAIDSAVVTVAAATVAVRMSGVVANAVVSPEELPIAYIEWVESIGLCWSTRSSADKTNSSDQAFVTLQQ